MKKEADHKKNPVGRLHVAYAAIVLLLSGILYLSFFVFLIPAIGSIYGGVLALILWVAMLVALCFQLLLYRAIRKQRRMSLAGLFLPLPFILLLPLLLGLMDEGYWHVPDLYLQLIPGNLLASAVFFYITIRAGKKAGIYAATIHIAGTFCLVLYCFSTIQMADMKVQHAMEDFYAADRQKRRTADSSVQAAADSITWNADGSRGSKNRFSAGKHKPDSELYYYPTGRLMTKTYIFDSTGSEYEREITLTEKGFPKLLSIRNRTSKESSTTEYFPDTKLVAKQTRVYDSSCIRYKQQLIFGRDGKLNRQSRNVLPN